MRSIFAGALAGAVLFASQTASAQNGEVTVSLSTWRALEQQLEALKQKKPPPAPFAIATRAIDLRFERGVLTGQLVAAIDVFSEGEVEVPLIDATASLSEVDVDGKRAVAIRSGASYVVLLDRPGRHQVRVRFARGREEARFSRSFVLPIPRAPVTRVELELPEKGLDVEIEGGVVLSQRATDRGTRIEGVLDGREALSVRWQRKLLHKTDQAREMEVETLTLASLGEELVRTKTRLDFKMISGEADRVELLAPPELEVTRVSGEAVLQWYTDVPATSGGPRRVIVLLKHLVDDRLSLTVDAEAALANDSTAKLAFLSPAQAKLRQGFVAVEGRDGFDVRVVNQGEGTEEIGTREVPPSLAGLSDKPLLFAYRHASKFPDLVLAVVRNAEIELTQAVIDDLEVSTVLVEQGIEVTKMRLYVRNNTRQYLTMRLPDGASLTHALIDGTPFHPAVSKTATGERLLIPLRQSEKLSDAKPRTHVVRAGETLGEISLIYFNRTDRWNEIIAANPGSTGPQDLYVGQRLVIPSRAGDVVLEESNFVLELAYKVQTPSLRALATHRATLPEMDVSVMSVTWHYYFPDAYEPLSFDSNLKQLSALRYDPLRRFLHFIEDVTEIRGAWAGEFGGYKDSYSNILLERKAIYHREQKREVTEALSAFPLVGERHRFSRVLLGEQQAFIEMVYAKKSLLPFVRWGAFFVFALLALRALASILEGGTPALLREPVWTCAAAAIVCVLIGQYVLGVHRALVLGVDAALLIAVIPRIAALRRSPVEPIPILGWLRARALVRIAVACIALALALAYPLLLSTFVLLSLLAVLLVIRRREVRHA
jgi:hypothetical protein